MSTQRSWIQRVLQRLLVPGRGEVRAMEEALHLENVLRFAGIFVVTILLPTSLLTYFGVTSIATEEAGVRAELSRTATVTADAFWSSVDREFTALERRILDRLEAGRSPLARPLELHPHLNVALRFDADGVLQAPFVRFDTTANPTPLALLHPDVATAEATERSGAAPELAAMAYGRAAKNVPWPSVQARMRYDQARMLARADRTEAAVTLYEKLAEEGASLRDPWGFRVGDLAGLARAELLVASDNPRIQSQGHASLRALVSELLTSRWTVGQGGEAAVVRHALSTLQHSDPAAQDYVSAQSSRLAERSRLLYWTGELLPELDAIAEVRGRQRLADGDLRWVDGGRAIWVTTWWGDSAFTFGLDRDAVVQALKSEARATALADAAVTVHLVAPDEPIGSDALVAKALAPWLTGWTVVVSPRDPQALDDARKRKRRRRTVVLLLAVGMIGLGFLTTVRLMKRELDVARSQADFAASVSHELRSPITHIRVHAESLLLDLMDDEEEKEDAYLSIVRESERLSRLVDNVLDFAAIERGAKRYALRPSDLAETVMRAIDSISSAQEVRDKELDVQLPADLPQVHLDADAVSQCVINLVSNAAKYSAPGGWIGVRGRITENGVEVTISDHGIGIAPHDLKQIFQPFYRSRDALARRRKGTGIGLTITRYIMRAHGGDVQVTSRPGKGSTFALRFPLKPPE